MVERTQTEGVQGECVIRENSLTQEGGSKRRLEKIS
jgi:hypothetical protein